MNLTPLRHRDVGLLWWAGLISMTGDWTLRVALPLAVLRLTGSPAAVSAVVLAGLAATLIIGPVAGGYVDRWDRRRVLVAVYALQVGALLPLLAVTSAGRVWIVVAVAFVETTLAQFSGPAENALLPRLVPVDQLAAANALNSANNWLARLAGPALGGLVAASAGLTGAVLLDAASYALAAVLCAAIRGRHRAVVVRPAGSPGRELAAGVRAVCRDRIARAVLVFGTLIGIGEGMMLTLFAVYVTDALRAGARELGWLLAAQAVGGIVGALVATRVRGAGRLRPVTLATWCFVLFGLGDLVIFNYPRWDAAVWPVVVLFFLIGIPGAIGYPVLVTLFQLRIPDALRGRGFAALSVSQAAAGMLGAALAGALGDRVPVMDLLTAQGAGYLLAGVLLRMLAGRGPDTLADEAPRTLADESPRAPADESPRALADDPERGRVRRDTASARLT
ncbi:MFS transporter [Plantactinospora sp. GCM10030261]|uniref:MFS transporter n=1 Tax=Plantactinospora sp. GCM10030261 TaxID=3273420 RepID=UPI003616C7D9